MHRLKVRPRTTQEAKSEFRDYGTSTHLIHEIIPYPDICNACNVFHEKLHLRSFDSRSQGSYAKAGGSAGQKGIPLSAANLPTPGSGRGFNASQQQGQSSRYNSVHRMDSQDSLASGGSGSSLMRRSVGGSGHSSRFQRQSSMDDGDDEEDDVMSPAMMMRLEALASFKSFMQGLDSQPQAYSLDEFIRGAANAIKVRERVMVLASWKLMPDWE